MFTNRSQDIIRTSIEYVDQERVVSLVLSLPSNFLAWGGWVDSKRSGFINATVFDEFRAYEHEDKEAERAGIEKEEPRRTEWLNALLCMIDPSLMSFIMSGSAELKRHSL